MVILSDASCCATLPPPLLCSYPDELPAERLFQISKPRRQERRGDQARRSVLQVGLRRSVLFLSCSLVGPPCRVNHSAVVVCTTSMCSCCRPDPGLPLCWYAVLRVWRGGGGQRGAAGGAHRAKPAGVRAAGGPRGGGGGGGAWGGRQRQHHSSHEGGRLGRHWVTYI